MRAVQNRLRSVEKRLWPVQERLWTGRIQWAGPPAAAPSASASRQGARPLDASSVLAPANGFSTANNDFSTVRNGFFTVRNGFFTVHNHFSTPPNRFSTAHNDVFRSALASNTSTMASDALPWPGYTPQWMRIRVSGLKPQWTGPVQFPGRLPARETSATPPPVHRFRPFCQI